VHCSPTAAPVLVADAAAAAAFPVARLSSDTGKRAKWERGGKDNALLSLCCSYCCWCSSVEVLLLASKHCSGGGVHASTC